MWVVHVHAANAATKLRGLHTSVIGVSVYTFGGWTQAKRSSDEAMNYLLDRCDLRMVRVSMLKEVLAELAAFRAAFNGKREPFT